jgi:hypothetical protein
MAATVQAELRACEPPRAPEAMVALGDAARALATRLLELEDAQLSQLTCAAGVGVLIVRGATHELPWVDGVRYLAALPGVPELLVPAHQTSSAPPELVARALARVSVGPSAWLRDDSGHDLLLPLAGLGCPSRARLRAFAASGRP